MRQTITLKLNRDFRRLYGRGKSCVSGCIVIYVMKNRRGTSRIGLTAGKAVGNAVKRNRAKRLMRESYRLMEDKLCPGYDMILVARSRIQGKKLAQVSRDMERGMRKLELMKHEKNITEID